MECSYTHNHEDQKRESPYKYVASSSVYWQISVYFLWVYINCEHTSETFFYRVHGS